MSEKKLILIAEDSNMIKSLISFKLEKAGYRTITAGDGKIALKTALEEPIDAVIMDIMMPFLDGFQVFKKLIEEKPGLPVLFLSSKNRPEEIESLMAMGAKDYLTKPFDPDQLLERLKLALGEE
jgi:DNA-binding response OmpR family regulator